MRPYGNYLPLPGGAAGRPESVASRRCQVRAQELQDQGWNLPATGPNPRCSRTLCPRHLQLSQWDLRAPLGGCWKFQHQQGICPGVMRDFRVWPRARLATFAVAVPRGWTSSCGARCWGSAPSFFVLAGLWMESGSVASKTRMTRRMSLGGASCVCVRHSNSPSPHLPPIFKKPLPFSPFEHPP